MRTELYAANLTEQPIVATGTTINFGSTIRRMGKCIRLNNGNVEMNGAEYGNILANVTIQGDATGGVATVTLYKDGIAIPGAKASQTLGASATASLVIPAMIRKFCNCSPTEITAIVTGVAGAITNASILVEKV